MGNLREVLTTHFVAQELIARGHEVVHLHSWDDYDRLRKLPAGVDPAFERYVGVALSDIPDPEGEYDSWAQRYMREFLHAIEALGVEMTEVRQSQRYQSGFYNSNIRVAMGERGRIFDELAAKQTPGRNERPLRERRLEFYPFKPYCEICGHDSTRVHAYERESVSYVCACGHEGEMSLADDMPITGKLVWKVDWPMRWAREHVAFEPAGEDHHAPSASVAVGREIVDVFGGRAPTSVAYSFVSLAGADGKMSSSTGVVATPETALEVLEPAMVRWLYLRRTPSQGFSIDLSPAGVQRLYDEWDQFVASASSADADAFDAEIYRACTRTSTAVVVSSPRPVSFRLLAAVADITQGNREHMGRVLAEHLDEPISNGPALLLATEPRLTHATHYVNTLLPENERTVVRATFDEGTWAALDESTRLGVAALAAELTRDCSLAELTSFIYAVPKRARGLADDAEVTPELKLAQREFFKAVYRLLIGKETGPRLPTLLLSLGSQRARQLLGVD
jgi:lysyl-tRNA synthetase class 1